MIFALTVPLQGRSSGLGTDSKRKSALYVRKMTVLYATFWGQFRKRQKIILAFRKSSARIHERRDFSRENDVFCKRVKSKTSKSNHF